MNKLRIYLHAVHYILLSTGAVSGFALAYYLDNFQWDFSANLILAKNLGIVSDAILKNYPKSRDVLTYFFALVLPVVGAFMFWLPWGLKRRRILSNILFGKPGFENIPQNKIHRLRIASLLLSMLTLVIFTFDVNLFKNEWWNSSTGAWTFLGEEGVFLEWTQRILNGEVRGKDFFTIYGPLMTYPLVLIQKIAGPTVSLGRWYTFILNLIAYSMLALIINRAIRSSLVAHILCLYFVAIFPWYTPVPNVTPLRVVLGLFSIVPLLKFRDSGNWIWLAVTGTTCGASFLFSQEVGICALLTSFIIIILGCFEERIPPAIVFRSIIFIVGLTAVLSPFLVLFTMHGDMNDIVKSFVSYPHFAVLGYGGLIFPSIADSIKSLGNPLVFDNYWIIFLYIICSISLLIRLRIGRINNKTVIITFLLIFGILLFRSALARSSTDRAFFVSPPAFILLFMAMDQCLYRFVTRKTIVQAVKVASIAVIITVVSVTMSYPRSSFIRLSDRFMGKNAFQFNTTPQTNGLKRDDVNHHPDTTRDIQLIADFFRLHPTPNGYAYFFPQEPAYYFLFDKRNPTRFSYSYLAITYDMRRELIDDLEVNKPLYIVYSKYTWRIDWIPEYVQVPEICDYITGHYEVMNDYGSVVFLRLKT